MQLPITIITEQFLRYQIRIVYYYCFQYKHSTSKELTARVWTSRVDIGWSVGTWATRRRNIKY